MDIPPTNREDGTLDAADKLGNGDPKQDDEKMLTDNSSEITAQADTESVPDQQHNQRVIAQRRTPLEKTLTTASYRDYCQFWDFDQIISRCSWGKNH